MIIYGINVVDELLRSEYIKDVNEIIFDKESKNKRLDELLEKAKGVGVKIRTLDKRSIENISKTTHHQGVICDIRLKYFDLEYLVDNGFNVLLCDSIQDPNNLGAMIRSAVLFNFYGIVIPKDRNTEITSSVIKVSSGAIFHTYPCRVVNLNRTIEILKESNYTIIGLDANATIEMTQAKHGDKVGIVIGSEGEGLRKLTKEKCDHLVKIPTTNKIDSLNASSAATIAMYQVFINLRKK